jgi:hypothetical protein
VTTYTEDWSGEADGVYPSGLTKRWTTTNETVVAANSLAEAEDNFTFEQEWSSTSVRRLNSFNAIDGDANRDDLDLVVRFRINETPGDYQYGLTVRASGTAGSETAYDFWVVESVANTFFVQLIERNSGVNGAVVSGADQVSDVANGDWLYMRVRCNGTTLQGRLWKPDETEPTTWSLDTTDATITAAGWGGILGFTTGSNAETDYIAAGTAGDTAPIDASTNTVLRITAGYGAALVTDASVPVRLTAAYAAALVKDDTTPVRITAAYAAVLYSGAVDVLPASAYIPAPLPFKTSFARKLQVPAELDEHPPTPISVAAETPALQANRVSFERDLQQPLQLDTRPKTPIPPAAFIPVPKANLTSFKRVRQVVLNPHVYPPTPAGFFDGFWPGSKRVEAILAEFERELQKLPQLDEFEVTPPGFFAGQFPAAVRLKRIPSAYHREAKAPLELNERPPTPPGFFEGHWPAPIPDPTHRTSFKRTLQTLAIPPVYPKTPVSAEDYGGYTKFPAENRIEFNRQIQPVLNPHVYPETPFGFQWGFYPGSKAVESFKVEFKRTRRDLPHNPEYPPTPAGFFDGFWPGSKAVESFNVSFTRVAQKLPELDEFEPTPPRFFEGFFPAPFRIKRIPSSYHRQAQRVLDPHVYPTTPVGFFDGFYPGSKRVESFVSSFKRTVQKLPELDRYKPTPPRFFEGFFPAPFRVKRIPSSYHREAQRVLNPHVYPATPVEHWPAHKRVEVNRTAFTRRLQTPLEIDRYPETPKSAVAYAGHTPVPTLKASFTRRLQSLGNPHVYPPTPAGFFDGFWPGSKRVEPLRSAYERRLAKLPQLDERPPPLPVVLALPQPAKRVKFTRSVQTVIHPELPTPTPPGFRWPRPPPPVLRSEFTRELAKLPQHDQWTPTPPRFFEGQYPAAFRVETHKVSFKRTPQPVVLSRFRPVAIVTAYRAVTTIRRRATTFKAFAPPLLQLSRIFPPSFIIGDARWQMRAIYRRDIQRVIQPVWNASPIVAEGFRPSDPDCIWLADCAPTVWLAQDESCI